MAHQPPQNIVIIGGGIAGVSTAYYLSISPNRPSTTSITLVEECKIAAGASGYSGGFLAKDWHRAATSSLAAMSYELHAKLAEEFDGAQNWGYRTVDTLSIETDGTRPSKRKTPLSWLPQGLIHSTRTLGTKTTTAQVHPGLLTNFLSRKFLDQPNTSLLLGKATHITLEADKPKSVIVGENKIPADSVVIAAGPWTGELSKQLLGEKVGVRLGVTGHRAHSIVLRTKEELTAHCLFTSMTMEDGSMGEPEVYTRPDGTTYICGAGDNEPLPASANEVKPSPSAIEKLHVQAQSLSPVFSKQGGVEIQAEQACFLPMADRGRPLIGKVRGVEGVYVGSGLSCWGITQGPGTGLVLSEMILEGQAKSADVSKLAL